MSGENVHGTFVSEKIFKIRWKPDDYVESQTFITGSWDNPVNSLGLWTYKIQEEDYGIYPFILKSIPFMGDVTEIKFVSNERTVISSSAGFVSLYNIRNDYEGDVELKEIHKWKNLHFFGPEDPSPCTALSINNDDIVTVGEDGKINLLTVSTNTPVRVIDNADSCSIQCVCFLRHHEVLTGNLRGHMKIWDFRQKDEPVMSFMLSGEQVSATCLAYHPTQKHVVLAGGEDGSLTVWDLRQNVYPVTLLDAHQSSVSEIQFHPQDPEKLFSSSISGELWKWNSNLQKPASNLLTIESKPEESSWINNDFANNKLEVFPLMPNLHEPINSLDVIGHKVICGCDNEAVYIINNIDD